MRLFGDCYRGRRVLVTGHTGFKGSWLTSWLLKLGASVVGVSKDVPTRPAMFEEVGLASRITHIVADVRDLAAMRRAIDGERPDFVFHLAAQMPKSQFQRSRLQSHSLPVWLPQSSLAFQKTWAFLSQKSLCRKLCLYGQMAALLWILTPNEASTNA